MSDDAQAPFKWRIEEATIEAHGFLLIFASSKDHSGPGELHTDFKIDVEGEPLTLRTPSGSLVDLIDPIALQPDLAFGSLIDGEPQSRVFFYPSSPGSTNALGYPLSLDLDSVSFSQPAGFYDDEFILELVSEQEWDLRYTLDGSDPQGSSPLYVDGILLKDRAGEEDDLPLIETGVGWKKPLSSVEKMNVLKVASFYERIRRSPVYTASYFISPRIAQKYSGLPVVSLSAHRDSLFSDERGIYVPGATFVDANALSTGNYMFKGLEWEREMHMEYFDSTHTKVLGQNIGVRIHGKSTRSLPQKSLRLYAGEEYGAEEMVYPFFKDKEIEAFRRLILRSPASDYGNTMFRDELCTELVKDMDTDLMASQKCILFINGTYWGIHTVRERIDEYYIEDNYAIDTEHVNLLSLNGIQEAGSSMDFRELFEYVQNHDMSDAQAYAYVNEEIDMNNLMDYLIAELYFANADWPFVNIRYWNSDEDGYRWRWIFHDCDRCMLQHEFDHLDNFIEETSISGNEPEWITTLVHHLMNNDGFRLEFMQRFIYHLSTTFHADRVLAKIDEMERDYDPLMAEHNNRWSYPGSVLFWKESLDKMRAFVLRRPAIMTQQLLDYFEKPYVFYPNPVEQGSDHVKLDMQYTEGVETRIQFFTSIGELALEMDLNEVHPDEDPLIPINKLQAGMYVVRIEYGILYFYDKLVVH